MSQPNSSGYVPASALSADSKVGNIALKIKDTPLGGDLLGIIKPTWMKAMESETRIAWLKDMIERNLVVRDIESFGKSSNEKLRAESSRNEELGRDALMELMRVKFIDEKRYYRECKKTRENVRNMVRQKLGRRRYDNLMNRLKMKIEFRKREIEKKYAAKTRTIEKDREEEILAKLEEVPVGLEEYAGSKIFSRAEMEKLVEIKQKVNVIGKVKIDEDESSILELNPKFAVTKKLCLEDMEHDIEICNAKLRYERRRKEEMIQEKEIYEADYG